MVKQHQLLLLNKSALYLMEIVLLSLILLNLTVQNNILLNFRALMFYQKLKLKLNYLFKPQQEQFTKALRPNFIPQQMIQLIQT